MKLDKKLLPEYSTQSVKVYSIPQSKLLAMQNHIANPNLVNESLRIKGE